MSKTKFTIIEVLDTLGEKKINRDDYRILYENFETQIDKKGYLQFKLTEKDKWKSVHTLVNQYFNQEEHEKKYKELVDTKIEQCLVTHHVNFFEKENKLNNHPDNLQWLGWSEHINLHGKIMREIMSKMWNPENPEYHSFEEQREKIRLGSFELWHGENNKVHREKMKQVLIKRNTESWNGENNEEYKEKMLPILAENGRKLWDGEDGEEKRINQGKRIKKISKNHWFGENNEENRKNHAERLDKLWYGENNEIFRKNHAERMLKQNSNPEHKQKSLEGKILKIFKKILEAGEKITNETFIKYKFNGAPYPITVFGSLENAIEKLKDYNPKRY